MAGDSSTFDDLDVYSEDVDQMDFKVIVVAVLAISSGLLGIILTVANYSFWYFPGPLVYLIMVVSLSVITGTIGLISLIAGWGLWRLEPWAWRTAMAAGIASLIFYLPKLSLPLIAINAVLVYFLRDSQLKNIYDEIVLP
ncbi:MAG: hypothetical protein OEV85_10520 [Candidatus Thorarchaeota archaeon]|nr:hypothetical protein [Candidatus Thorarchaeota archaeon]